MSRVDPERPHSTMQTDQGAAVQIIVCEFMSLDGVVQAPGGPEEDTDGGFAHGGWSHPYFDPEVMGPVLADVMTRSDALLYGRRTGRAWPPRGPTGPVTPTPTS